MIYSAVRLFDDGHVCSLGGKTVDFASLAAAKKVAGIKQTMRLLEKDLPKMVLIAKNAQKELVAPLVEICENKQVETVWIDDSRLLGELCGIAVRTAAAAVIE